MGFYQKTGTYSLRIQKEAKVTPGDYILSHRRQVEANEVIGKRFVRTD